MANEYLKRTPTSTGNQRVFTISVWIKRSASGSYGIFGAGDGASGGNSDHLWLNSDVLGFSAQDGTNFITSTPLLRDVGSWTHYHYIQKTDDAVAADRGQFFVNGVRLRDASSTTFSINQVISWMNKAGAGHAVGARNRASFQTFMNGEMMDFFFVDGQALTPDVFGFYKDGDGYISAGSTEATDFRPGQWVPHAPRKIKKDVNRRGGFGVNGFYLPMNSSNNPGADFHCTPNTILKLKEDLPQPKAEIDGVGDYTGALRDDPFKQYLVLAVPGVIGGKQSGYGDYSADIKGSGTNKTLTANGNAAVASVSSYYGSAMSFDGTGDHVRTTSSLTDFQFGTGDFTVEAWIFKSAQGSDGYDGVISLGGQGSATDGWFIEASNTRGYLWFTAGSATYKLEHNVSVNISQWNHICVERHNSITTMYLNGVAVDTTTSTYSIPTTGTFLDIGGYGLDGVAGTGEYYFNGRIQDVRVYKGLAKYKGGFDVPKPYTPVGIEAFRTTTDTCKNNFATLNPLSYQTTGTYGSSYPVLSNGNLTFTHGVTTEWERSHASFGVGEGKWYYEFQIVTRPIFVAPNKTENWAVGVRESDSSVFYGETDGFEDLGDHIYWIDAGTARIVSNQDRSAGATSGISSAVNGDIINIAFEKTATALEVWFGKNGTYFNSGNPATGANPAVNHATTTEYIIPAAAFYQYSGQVEPVGTFNFGQNPAFSGQVTAGTNADDSGKGLFKYAPPTGFLALCEDNLPTPAIADPGKHFKTVLWTGDGNGRGITGVGFKPDFVWIKERTSLNTVSSHRLFDSVRGAGNVLLSDGTTQELYRPDDFRSFDENGFSVGTSNTTNETGSTFVAWCWKAGDAAVSNTDGSITSQVSVNQDAGFSIVFYDGTGSDSNTGHGLSKTPDFIIWKAREDAYNWDIYHSSLGYQASLIFTNAATRNVLHAAPTSTTIPVTHTYTGGSANGKGMIAYCWTEIEGFSKFGSYVGNGNADGSFVYCGFKPAFVLIKDTDLDPSSWIILDSSRDSVNPCTHKLFPSYLGAENVSSPAGATAGTNNIDFVSNGFKLRSNNSWSNYPDTYIFMAFAESPFQTANAK